MWYIPSGGTLLSVSEYCAYFCCVPLVDVARIHVMPSVFTKSQLVPLLEYAFTLPEHSGSGKMFLRLMPPPPDRLVGCGVGGEDGRAHRLDARPFRERATAQSRHRHVHTFRAVENGPMIADSADVRHDQTAVYQDDR